MLLLSCFPPFDSSKSSGECHQAAMPPGDFRQVFCIGLFWIVLIHLSVLQSVTGNVLTTQRILHESVTTERQVGGLTRTGLPRPTTSYKQNTRFKRQVSTTTTARTSSATTQRNGSSATTVSVRPGANASTTRTTRISTVSTSSLAPTTTSSTGGHSTSTYIDEMVDFRGDNDNLTMTSNVKPQLAKPPSADGIVTQQSRSPKYIIPTQPPFDTDIVADLPERQGKDEAIVETRPFLLHPPFTTYMLMITIPCVVGWCLLIFACLWICRPNSPLYREILHRLIEHSYMKQKSVLFSATVLAADKHAPVIDVVETPTKKKEGKK